MVPILKLQGAVMNGPMWERLANLKSKISDLRLGVEANLRGKQSANALSFTDF
jgi:hypothetical protein